MLNVEQFRSEVVAPILTELSLWSPAALFGPAAGDARHLTWNLGYGVAMCQVHYMWVREALPDAGNFPALAAYWKA